jgi:hypothetical protein
LRPRTAHRDGAVIVPGELDLVALGHLQRLADFDRKGDCQRLRQRCAPHRSAHMLGFEKRQCDLVGLCGLWLPVPDGAVGHDGAVGAPPLDLAALELLLV